MSECVSGVSGVSGVCGGGRRWAVSGRKGQRSVGAVDRVVRHTRWDGTSFFKLCRDCVGKVRTFYVTIF